MSVRVCPFCAAEVDDEPWCEIAHMNSVHPEIVARRLRDAGLQDEADEVERSVDLDAALDGALAQLQCEIAKLAIFLPDLPERHKRLIDGVLAAIDDWVRTR